MEFTRLLIKFAPLNVEPVTPAPLSVSPVEAGALADVADALSFAWVTAAAAELL